MLSRGLRADGLLFTPPEVIVGHRGYDQHGDAARGLQHRQADDLALWGRGKVSINRRGAESSSIEIGAAVGPLKRTLRLDAGLLRGSSSGLCHSERCSYDAVRCVATAWMVGLVGSAMAMRTEPSLLGSEKLTVPPRSDRRAREVIAGWGPRRRSLGWSGVACQKGLEFRHPLIHSMLFGPLLKFLAFLWFPHPSSSVATSHDDAIPPDFFS
jgi:hypothetical protein